jgi:hypothetical protein
MPGDLLDLLGKAINEMRDFLQRAQECVSHGTTVSAALVKSLAARLRQVGEATRAARAEDIARARASSVYSEYKYLLNEVQSALKPLQDQLVARQAEIGAARSQVAAVSSWTSAYERTR